jgi:hypothetical protein
VVKNKIAPPFREAEFDIMYNQGISRSGDILDLAVANNIVEKAGAWFAYNDAKIGQGREALAYENLLQISGRCQVTLLDEAGNVQDTYDLTPGTSIRMEKGQWHIHANPFTEPSITQFKAEGDITEIVDTMRHKFNRMDPDEAPKQL